MPHLLPFLLTQLTGTRASLSEAESYDGNDVDVSDLQAANATAQIQALRVLVLLGRRQGLGAGLGLDRGQSQGRGLEKGGSEDDSVYEGKREAMFLSLLAVAMYSLGMTATSSSSLGNGRSGGHGSGSSDDVVDGGGVDGDVGEVALWAITEVCRSLTTGGTGGTNDRASSTGTRANAAGTRASASTVGARARAWRVFGEEGIITRCMATILPAKSRVSAGANASGATGVMVDVDGVQGRAAVTILLAVAQVMNQTTNQPTNQPTNQTNKQTNKQTIELSYYPQCLPYYLLMACLFGSIGGFGALSRRGCSPATFFARQYHHLHRCRINHQPRS